MIPRIQKAGGSFVGAGRYYLHDKAADRDMPRAEKPKTDERVWFTDTRNLFATDPERAFVEMWKTAEDQQWLKTQAGSRTTGGACEDPVKTMSLAWHKEDQPSPEHMVAAADAFLKHMGWEQHQAVYIGHRDTEHLHLHIVLNKVHPDTGKTLNDWRDQPRAQAWALAYEKEHGKVWCVEREINAAERENRAPEFDHAMRAPASEKQPANQHVPHNIVELARPFERAFEAAEQERRDQFDAERATLKAEQRAEREAWFKEGKDLFRQLRHDVYDAVRAEHKAAWRDYYTEAKAADQHASAVIGDALLRAHHFARAGDWEKAEQALHDPFAVRDDTDMKLHNQKIEIVQAQKDELQRRQKEACDALLAERKEQYAELLVRQREERASMRGAHVQGQSAEFVLETRAARAEERQQANDNRQPEAKAPEPMPTLEPIAERMRGAVEAAAPIIAEVVQNERSTALNEPAPGVDRAEGPEPVKGAADLAAGGIAAVAGYVADQLAELFAPTPPEVREQRAKDEAKRDTEKPAKETALPASWQRHIEAVIKAIQQEEDEKRARGYWEERDRGKDFGRDR